MREFDLESLSEFNGKDGKPVYIVHQGNVFDVSQSKLWKGGVHMRRHHAGTDLTTDIGAAPHGTEVLERYPQVGVVRQQAPAEANLPDNALFRLLNHYPFLRRHPHPMTVHFPIVFMMSTTAFTLLYLLTGVKSFDVTALHCLGAGLLFTPIVILTGLFTWWLNYMAKPSKSIHIKLVTSLLLFFIALIAFTWRASVPDILDSSHASGWLYLMLILSLAPLVTIIGWFGAKLTFPFEDH